MLVATIFRFARTIRCAMVISATRKAAAISPVVKPTTARSVSATCASCDSAGWQQVKISRSRSSASPGSVAKGERSSSSSFSRYLLSRRRISIARRRAVVINHAPGLSGMPCSGHFSSAATRLSWTTSSARSKSPRVRTNAAVRRPASSRKTATSNPVHSSEFKGARWPAALAAVCVSAVLGGLRRPSGFRFRDLSRVVDDGPHLYRPGRPCLGYGKRLVEILDLDDREPSDDLLGLDVRSVGDDCLAVLDAHRRRAARPLELLAADQPAGPALLLEPLARPLVWGVQLILGQVLKGSLVVGATHEHEDVLHFESLQIRAVCGAASFIPTNGTRRNRHLVSRARGPPHISRHRRREPRRGWRKEERICRCVTTRRRAPRRWLQRRRRPAD